MNISDIGLDRAALLDACERHGITGTDAASAVDALIGQLSTDTVRVVACLIAESGPHMHLGGTA